MDFSLFRFWYILSLKHIWSQQISYFGIFVMHILSHIYKAGVFRFDWGVQENAFYFPEGAKGPMSKTWEGTSPRTSAGP